MSIELNIDGLVGPTHHYAGLATGNIASTKHAMQTSNPKAAAHQGLSKMRLLHQASLKQALLPPHQRPNLQLLSQLGFTGTPTQQIEKAYRAAPELLHVCYSASNMWAANTATVSASQDTQDHLVHFTTANLVSHLHRVQEAEFSKQLLHHIFNDNAYFHHHSWVPGSLTTSDEGAANHCRLCPDHSATGINLFVYNRYGLADGFKYLGRQTFEASQTIVRYHQLDPCRVIFACQNPTVTKEGVFHNDIIALNNESLLLLHEDAFLDQKKILDELEYKADFPLQLIEIRRNKLTVAEAVNSYFFNSQLITLPSYPGEKKQMALIAPIECAQSQPVKNIIEELLADDNNPITTLHYMNLKQSMHNGGGPACLRLRVPLTEPEFQAMHQGVVINNTLLDELNNWITRHYRSALHPDDLRDPLLMDECFTALDELSVLLKLGSIYPFQCEKNAQ